MASEHEPQLLSVQQVLAKDAYCIPVYQRNYAWGVDEITLLMADVQDYVERQEAQDYYIGTLVVHGRNPTNSSGTPQQQWEVVDGQQRLTTLSLLVSVLRGLGDVAPTDMPHMPLQFECRAASSMALQTVFAEPLQAQKMNKAGAEGDDGSGAQSIWQGREVIAAHLRTRGKAERQKFADFLLHRVKLLRVTLPPRTDLNHYFECMNNRGEQLAKHEVLKARLLGELQTHGDAADMQMLHAVWQACATMDRSVQAGFSPTLRARLFSADGLTLAVASKEALLACFDGATGTNPPPWKLTIGALQTLIAQSNKSQPEGERGDQEDKEQFGPVINFPNFLLHVLALMPDRAGGKIPLDDKHLLEAFEAVLYPPQKAEAVGLWMPPVERVHCFTFLLLRCRFLLDQYVIKRGLEAREDEEHWQLKRFKFRTSSTALQQVNSFGKDDVCDEEGALPGRIRMLQSAFHVSYMLPTRKHWLQGVLGWLLQQDIDQAIDAAAFLMQLEALAKAFVLDVGSDAENAPSYEDVVRRNDGFYRAEAVPLDDEVWLQKLCYGSVRLIDFNFLDYLLWLQGDVVGGKDFAFTSSRRSVEHLYPQTPLAGGTPWSDTHLHTFGNLCLISHAMNSRLGNAVPEGKFQQLLHEKRRCSLKVLAMHQAFKKKGAWTAQESMQRHQAHMLQLLRHAFASNGLIQPPQNQAAAQ